MVNKEQRFRVRNPIVGTAGRVRYTQYLYVELRGSSEIYITRRNGDKIAHVKRDLQTIGNRLPSCQTLSFTADIRVIVDLLSEVKRTMLPRRLSLSEFCQVHSTAVGYLETVINKPVRKSILF